MRSEIVCPYCVIWPTFLIPTSVENHKFLWICWYEAISPLALNLILLPHRFESIPRLCSKLQDLDQQPKFANNTSAPPADFTKVTTPSAPRIGESLPSNVLIDNWPSVVLTYSAGCLSSPRYIVCYASTIRDRVERRLQGLRETDNCISNQSRLQPSFIICNYHLWFVSAISIITWRFKVPSNHWVGNDHNDIVFVLFRNGNHGPKPGFRQTHKPEFCIIWQILR